MMSKICLFVALAVCTSLAVFAQKPLTIGEIQTLQSAVLAEERTLNVYLPTTYDPSKKYPVIYVLDGTINEDFLHIVGLTQFFNMMFGMPDCIVVGIANVDRKRDFTFHTDIAELKKAYPTTGSSDKFIAFLEQELRPFVDKKYPTSGTNFLIGQSLGGLLATEILFKKPELFSHYLIVSPSLWWDDESLLKVTPKLMPENLFVFVAAGENEPRIMRKDARKLYKMLKKQETATRKIHFKMMRNENHATILHNCIYRAFEVLYPFE